MVFIGQATYSKKTTQTQLFFRYVYFVIAVYAHFNRFIDLTINSHTNPYNLASSRLM